MKQHATGPRYLIIRIEPIANETKPSRECAPALAHLSEYRRSRPIPSRQEYVDLATKHGFELAPFGSTGGDWDLIAYCYTSPNKEGRGRAGDQLRRIRARKVCYVCNRRWEGEPGWGLRKWGAACPRHRRESPAMTTLGDMLAEKAAAEES